MNIASYTAASTIPAKLFCDLNFLYGVAKSGHIKPLHIQVNPTNKCPLNCCGGRIQYEGIRDFMPQFFMVEGSFASETKVFSDIAVTNEYTSEQCLGDEFSRHIKGSFLDNAHVIASNAYSYSDGLLYQVKEGI